MLTTSLKRIVRTGFYSFWRNGFVSLAAVLIMTTALLVVGSVMFMNAVFTNTLEGIQDRVDVNVYFVPDATEQQIFDLKESLEALPEVSHVAYVSREEVLARFRERHQDDQINLQALEELESNPLGAQLNIRAYDPSQYEGIDSFLGDRNTSLSGEQIINKVNFQDNLAAINKLSKIISASEVFGLGISILLIAISILITFNTIRLAIYVSREEISVMRLVGASASYIRGPFVFTGIIYGLVSGLITLIVFYIGTLWLGNLTEQFFININIFDYYTSNFGIFFLAILGFGVVMGAISSYLAVMRYLKS